MAQAPTEAGFAALFTQLQQSGKAGHVWTLNKIAEAPEGMVERIDAALREYGITSLPNDTLGGNMSIAAEIPGRDAVLRISDDSVEPPRPRHPGVLQPLFSPQTVDNFRIEVLPKVTTLQEALDTNLVSRSDARKQVGELMSRFEQSGLFFWDCKIADIGVVPDENGAPRLVVIDGGAVCPESEKFAGKIGNDTQTNYDKYLRNRPFLEEQLSGNVPNPPQFLYHGSCAGIDGPLTPRSQNGNVNGEFPDGPRDLVFATSNRSVAALYALKTPELLSVSSFSEQHIGLFRDYDNWRESIEKAPCTLYTLPRQPFSNVIHEHNGNPSYEWMSEVPVTPVDKQRVTPEAVMADGTQLFFLHEHVSKEAWHKFSEAIRPTLQSLDGTDVSGAHLMRELQDAGVIGHHLNREQDITPMELPKHSQLGKLIASELDALKQSAALRQQVQQAVSRVSVMKGMQQPVTSWQQYLDNRKSQEGQSPAPPPR